MIGDISSIKDQAFQYALKLVKQGARDTEKRYLIENEGMIRQALRSPSEVVSVLAVPDEARSLQQICLEKKVLLYSIRPGILQKLVGTGYETGVTSIAVVGQRLLSPESLISEGNARKRSEANSTEPEVDSNALEESNPGSQLFLAGESIQDPRNVGVLVRTAEAAGCAALILSADSADAFSRAAVRSTTGSILRLPICIVQNLPSLLHSLAETGYIIVASSASAPSLAYDAPLNRRPLCLVVGNETVGMSAAGKAAATLFVRLPMASNGASSLNVTVAAGALLFEAVRQGGEGNMR